MKKLLFILTIFISVSSFAQTKEETIEWIKEKLIKHSVDESKNKNITVEIINISPCEISYNLKYTFYNSGDVEVYDNYFFNPSSTFWIEQSCSEHGVIKQTNLQFKTYNVSYIYCIRLYNNGISDIKERFAKALNHLATFCPKKKETF